MLILLASKKKTTHTHTHTHTHTQIALIARIYVQLSQENETVDSKEIVTGRKLEGPLLEYCNSLLEMLRGTILNVY